MSVADDHPGARRGCLAPATLRKGGRRSAGNSCLLGVHRLLPRLSTLALALGTYSCASTKALEITGRDGSPTLVPARSSGAWVVRVHEAAHDCAPDAESCDKRFEASSDGTWLGYFEPHPTAKDGRAVIARRTFSPAHLSELRKLVETGDFQREMTAGFACQGKQQIHDWSVVVTLVDADGERTQHAELCLARPPEERNAPRRLMTILER